MSDIFMAELHGKWLGLADTFIAQSRERNRNLADIAQSLARIAQRLEEPCSPRTVQSGSIAGE